MRDDRGRPKYPYSTAEERIEAASSREAAPEVTSAAIICSGPAAVERFRMITCLTGLKLESQGIKPNRHVSMLKVARCDYGIRAKSAAVAYIRMRQMMEEKGIIVPKEDNGQA